MLKNHKSRVNVTLVMKLKGLEDLTGAPSLTAKAYCCLAQVVPLSDVVQVSPAEVLILPCCELENSI